MKNINLVILISIIVLIVIIVIYCTSRVEKYQAEEDEKNMEIEIELIEEKEPILPPPISQTVEEDVLIEEKDDDLTTRIYTINPRDVPDDVMMSAILPFLELEELARYSRSSSEHERLVNKFLKGILKFDNIWILNTMTYFKTISPGEYIFENPANGREMLPTESIGSNCYDIFKIVLQNVIPPPIYKKFLTVRGEIENKWIIFNDSYGIGIYFNMPHSKLLEQPPILDKYNHTFLATWPLTYQNQDLKFIELSIWFKNLTEEEEGKIAEDEMLQISQRYQALLNEKLVLLRQLKQVYNFPSYGLFREPQPFRGGMLYNFHLFLARYNGAYGYKKYLQFIRSLK